MHNRSHLLNRMTIKVCSSYVIADIIFGSQNHQGLRVNFQHTQTGITGHGVNNHAYCNMMRWISVYRVEISPKIVSCSSSYLLWEITSFSKSEYHLLS